MEELSKSEEEYVRSIGGGLGGMKGAVRDEIYR